MLNVLILHFKVLTPLYLGGADMMADLRAPGFKGPLRQWYRAVDPNFSEIRNNKGFAEITREEHFFGGSREGAGQSPFLMRVDSEPFKEYKWIPADVNKHNKGKGPETVNGLAYLGYPFGLNKTKSDVSEKRTAISPGHTFRIRCVIPPKNNNQELRQVLAASWWGLGHLGGAGSRSRRGFGSLALTRWETTPDSWPELDSLPLLANASSVDEWQQGLGIALNTMRSWFKKLENKVGDQSHHPHLGKNSRIMLLHEAFPPIEWEKGMAHMGERMQQFRKNYNDDKKAIKSHMMALDKKNGAFLEHAPDRSTFGLPLTFRVKGMKGSLEFLPFDPENFKTLERHGSLLHMRLVSINDKLYPLFVRLSGDVPGMDPAAAIKNNKRPLRRPIQNAMDLFLKSLA